MDFILRRYTKVNWLFCSKFSRSFLSLFGKCRYMFFSYRLLLFALSLLISDYYIVELFATTNY